MGMSMAGIRVSRFTSFMGLAAALLVMAGCGGPSSGGGEGPEVANATTDFFLTVPPELGAGSVRICGERDTHAHMMYPCRNDVRYDTDDACPCFDLDQNGVPTTDGGALVFSGLCPSDNIPESPWTFSYQIWSGSSCGGTLLNDPENSNNFRCFDIQDLAAMEYMNQSVEWLEIGYNHNQIICLSKNSTKDWDFQFCEDKTGWVECGPHTTVLDCGCEPVDSQCGCPDGLMDVLPWNCTSRPENDCDIWCEGASVQAEVGFMSFANGNGNRKGLQLGAFGGPTEGHKYVWQNGPNHRFEWAYDHKNKKLTLTVWKDGTSSKTQATMFLGNQLAELNSLEVRLTNHERQPVWIELTDLRITGRQEPLATRLQAPGFGTRTHAFWLGAFQGNFTVSGMIRLQGGFSRDAEDAAKIEILVGRNLASPPKAR